MLILGHIPITYIYIYIYILGHVLADEDPRHERRHLLNNSNDNMIITYFRQ